MKHIVDTDALKDCLKLLHSPTTVCGKRCVYLENVIDMIDKFPKDKHANEKVCGIDLKKEKEGV